MRRRNGFTLIELLVVIAIIAILAAILFPVFASAKKQAQKASCASGVKQLSAAFRIYADDNQDSFPPNFTISSKNYPNGEPTHNSWWLWIHNLYPYVKNNKVFNCPAAIAQFAGGYYWKGGAPDKELLPYGGEPMYYNASYGYNRWLGRYQPPIDKERVTFNRIARTTDTPLLADCSYYLTGPQYDGNSFPLSARHDGMTVMSFVDGHSKVVNRKDWSTTNAWSKTNPDPVWRKWDPLLQ